MADVGVALEKAYQLAEGVNGFCEDAAGWAPDALHYVVKAGALLFGQFTGHRRLLFWKLFSFPGGYFFEFFEGVTVFKTGTQNTTAAKKATGIVVCMVRNAEA